MVVLTPGPYRNALKIGMDGTDVAALQLNLHGTAVDGIFGSQTRRSVKGWQARYGLEDDGIAGGITMTSMITRLSRPAEEAHGLPRRFLESKSSKEASLNLAAWVDHAGDDGFDLGAFQLAFGPHNREVTQSGMRFAYTVAEAAEEVASSAWKNYEHYLHGAATEQGSWYGTTLSPGAVYDPKIFAWQLAALAHNWPGAAEHLAAIGRVYMETGRDDHVEDWIVAATGGRLSTPRQWVLDYIPGATVYVRW